MGINIRRNYNHQDSKAVLLEKIVQSQENEEEPIQVEIASHLISINVKQVEHHWWSPEMSLRIEERDDGVTIYETIGPNPSMFTLSMFFVTLGAVMFLAALMWALSQMAVGESSVIAWMANFISGLVIVATFGVLAIGRIKAADQVASLRQFIANIL